MVWVSEAGWGGIKWSEREIVKSVNESGFGNSIWKFITRLSNSKKPF